MSDYEYYSDDDYLDSSQQEKYNIIKNYTLNDYLSCNETKKILDTNWNNNFKENMDEQIKELLLKHYNKLTINNTNVLYHADENNYIDLYNIIKYHTQIDYDTSVFEENPELATPLINQYDNIKKQRKRSQQNNIQNAMNISNRKYNWHK